VTKLGEYANSLIAENMDAYNDSVKKNKQIGAAKTRSLKRSTYKKEEKQ